MQQVVLFIDGQDTEPRQIVAAWETLRQRLPWLPQWFKAENVQDIMQYLFGDLAAENLVSVFQIRMFAPIEPANGVEECHVDVVENITDGRRVFIGPAGCAGVPNIEAGGAVNFHWKTGKAEGEPREMVMDIYC